MKNDAGFDRKPKKSNKHIVIDARNLRSSTGRYVYKLVEHLQGLDKQNKYTILVPLDDRWEPTAKNFKKVEVGFPQFSTNPINDLRFAWQLYRLKPDLVHFSMTQHPVSFFPLKIKLFGLNSKMIVTTHDLTMFRFARANHRHELIHKIRMIMYRFLFWLAHKKASKIIVPTNFVKNDLSDYQPFTSKKIIVTYEAADPPQKIKPQQINGVGDRFIMHVGSPFPHKNIDSLIDAFSLVKKDHPDVELVLIGKKEFYFTRLMSDSRSNEFYNDIHFTGFVDDDQLSWAYQNTACYVLPSLSEGFGLPGLEAMAYGAPLASSDSTCLPEVYADAAHFFDPENTDDMARAINDVLSSDRLAKELVKKGAQQIKKYSWHKTANETQKIYQAVLSD